LPWLECGNSRLHQDSHLVGYEVIGIHNGWEGLLEHDDEVLSVVRTSGIIDRGGTILGTSRVSPLRIENGVQRVKDRFNVLKLEALVVFRRQRRAQPRLQNVQTGIPLVGIPKTMIMMSLKRISQLVSRLRYKLPPTLWTGSDPPRKVITG